MNQITIKIDQLKPSPFNVRPKHTKEDIKMMANSIKNRGIINAPSVAINGDGFQIIAGNLRVAGARAAGLTEVECDDVSELDDAARVELSLSENVDRRRMSVIQEYIAFDKLFKAGRTVEDIASRFDKTVRNTQQILAIGSLPKKILAAEIGDRTIRCLAIAPKADVRRYMKLTPKDRPRDWEIQDWLAGNDGMYLAKNALFDTDEITTEYKGGSFVDLFAEDDEVWFTDGAQFMELQNAALDAKLAEFKKNGWNIEQLEYWQSWAYERLAKKKGGKVLYTKDEKSGAIAFYVGYARLGRAGSAPKSKDGKPAKKPETSKAFDDYCTELRFNAVRSHMVKDKRAGLIGTVVLLLKQSDNISFRYTGGKVKNQAYIDSINEQDDNLDIQDARLNVWTELGVADGQTWQVDTAELVAKLEEYPVASLQRFITTIVTAEWFSEGKESDVLGKAFGLNGVDQVTLDDAFWNGITNKKTLLKIAEEHKIIILGKPTVKVIRQKVKDGVPESWLPDFLTF